MVVISIRWDPLGDPIRHAKGKVRAVQILLIGLVISLCYFFFWSAIRKTQPLFTEALSQVYSPLSKRQELQLNTTLVPPDAIPFSKTEFKNCSNTKDYFALTEKLPGALHPRVTEDDLMTSLSGIKDKYEYSVTSFEQLRGEIIHRLHLQNFLDGMDERPLEVAVVSEKSNGGYFRQDLLFRDPLVGSFEAILIAPVVPGPHPAIIAVHGHSSSAQNYVWDFQVPEIAKRGFIVITWSLRGVCGDENEDRLTRHLLTNGFSTIGIIVYETLLMEKYARSLSAVDETRLGLIGHSGGSDAGNLTIHVGRHFKAFITDHSSQYQDRRKVEGKIEFLDSYVPSLWELSDTVNSFRFCPAPVLKTGYGYAGEFGTLFDFLKEHLK